MDDGRTFLYAGGAHPGGPMGGAEGFYEPDFSDLDDGDSDDDGNDSDYDQQPRSRTQHRIMLLDV